MIDRTRLRRLLLLAVVLLLVSAAAAFAVTQSLALLGGLLLGLFLGASPFASWTWILSRGLSTRGGRILSVLLLAAKIGVYGALVYLTRDLVQPAGIVIGLTGVIFIMTVGMLLPAPAKAGEAA